MSVTENEAKTIDDCLKELRGHRSEYLKRSTPWRIINRAVRLIIELKEYKEIGTIEEFKALKEKSEPKKPFQPFGTHSYKCSNCWQFVAHEVDDNCDLETTMADYCPYCGQKLDWQ